MWDTVTILGWLNRLRAASQGSSLRHGFPRNGHSHQSVCPVFQGKTKHGLHQQTKQHPSINPSAGGRLRLGLWSLNVSFLLHQDVPVVN